MKHKIIHILKSLFDNPAGQRFLEKVHLLVLYLQNYGLAGECDSSGEESAMKIISEKLKNKNNLMIFDVGANIGKYTLSLKKFLKSNYTIHCFEPVHATFETLLKNTQTDQHIFCHNIALGNNIRETKIFSNAVTHTQSSLIARDMSHWGEEYNLTYSESIKETTLSDFCNSNKIDFIDFLKLDVEGYEMMFFKGASDLLGKKIGIIQFEFGVCAVDGKYFFKDVFYLLKDNYRIFRITKNNLYEIKNYREQYEVFLTTNYLAVLK